MNAGDAELAASWRRRADELEARARELRRDGDPEGATDCESAAVDYRADADELELALKPTYGLER